MNFEKRVKDHFRDLRKGTHKNPRLQNCYDKYGVDSLVAHLLFDLPKDEFIHKEIEQIILNLFLHEENCLNINETAGGGCIVPMTNERKRKIGEANKGKTYERTQEHKKKISESLKGHTVTDETKKKISQSHLGKTLSKDHREKLKKAFEGENNPRYGIRGILNSRSKPVLQIDMETLEIINEFAGLRELERKTGFDRGSVGKVCREELPQIYGYFWCYKEDYNDGKKEHFQYIQKYIKNKLYRKFGKENPSAKAVIQLDLEGNEIRELETLTSVKKFGYDPSYIAKVCKGKAKTAYGYKWKYKESVTTIESN